MGLNEKRKLKELQEASFPERTRELEEICGCPVAYDVDWATFADDYEAMNFVDNVACHRVNMALRVICSDSTGKEAVRDGLKTIRIRNVKAPDTKSMAFSSGVLELNGSWSQGLNGAWSDNEIRHTLENGL